MLALLVILHLFIYPASNAFNSYFDKDEGSIGGLKNPPKVDKGLYYLATFFDLIGLILTQVIFNNWTLTLMVLTYILVSRAYSSKWPRLKRYALLSWFIAGFFQGAWVVWITYIGLNDFELIKVLHAKIFIGGILASAILWGSYPMTQLYQHEEDARRGDRTMSLLLGIKGTFLFTAICFAIASIGFFIYLKEFFEWKYAWTFLMAMSPVVFYFSWWWFRTIKNTQFASYELTMRLNWISSTVLAAFYIYLFLDSTQVLNVVGVY